MGIHLFTPCLHVRETLSIWQWRNGKDATTFEEVLWGQALAVWANLILKYVIKVSIV